jgi:hypothetical protein
MPTLLEASLSAGAIFVSSCYVLMLLLVMLLNVMLLLMMIFLLALQFMLMQMIRFRFLMHMMLLLCSYANEAIIVWNAPLPHQADPFLTECLDLHFREARKWHFWSIDKKNRPLVSLISKVIDRLMKRETKLEFMTYKK